MEGFHQQACPFDVKLCTLCWVAGFPSDDESCISFFINLCNRIISGGVLNFLFQSRPQLQ